MSLNFKNPLTDRMTTIINEGCLICANHQNRDVIFPKDILLSILNDQSEVSCKILEVAGVNIEDLKVKILDSDCPSKNQKRNTKANMHPLSNFILQKSDYVASELGYSFIGTEHVILAFLLYRGKESHLKRIVSIFDEYNIYFETFKDSIVNYYMSSTSDISYGNDKKKAPNKKNVVEKNENGEKNPKDSVNDNLFLRNVNKKVINSNTKVIGRDIEFERAIRILSRKNKNNIILVGKEGTGKTNFIEGLAKKITDGEIAGKLKNVTILSLDLAGMIAGTKYRGQFEERIKNVIDFLSKKRQNEKYILFIDEIHQILGTGAAEGALDAGSIIKAELSNGNVQCIGATTTKEYKKYILRDGPLSRRMSPIFIEESSTEDTIKILEGIKEEYELYHGISVSKDIVTYIVNLCNLYISNRNFPDKAIDILDESCTKKSIESSKPMDIEILEEKIYKIRKKIEINKNRMDFDKCRVLISQRDILISELNKKKYIYEERMKINSDGSSEILLDKDTVRKVVSDFSGVPIIDDDNNKKKLIDMDKYLNDIVINQNEAIDKICKAIFRSKAGLKDPDKPTGVYLFLGDSGCGKTLLSKELAKYHFGSKDKFIRIDMSEYMEKHSISKIIGSPHGYLGYDDVDGKLVDKIKTNPYSVVLLDEFEKAHPDVFNLFLQTFDEGRLTNSHGETIDFRNVIFIMTSNIGTSKINKGSMGFDHSQNNIKNREKIFISELKKIVSPEFFNRIDEVIIFNSLDKKSVVKILDIEILNINKRLLEYNISIECSEKSKDFLISKGFDEKYGARPMKRAVEKYISNLLAPKIISNEYQDGSIILLDYIEGDELLISTKKLLAF